MSDDMEQIATDEEYVAPETTSGAWLPEGRSASEELKQPRYLIAVAVALIIILLQIWVLF